MAAKKPKQKRFARARTAKCTTENETGTVPTLESLKDCQTNIIDKFEKAESTRTAYSRYVAMGQTFLEQIIKNAKAEAAQTDGTLKDSEASSLSSLCLADPTFSEALKDKPNVHSPQALVFFITQKCEREGKGRSTADGIRAAFKDLWWRIADGAYRGEWRKDPDTKEWVGNPAKAAMVTDLMKALKNKQGADGYVRQHSRAMRFEHMQKIFKWSESECPVPDVNQTPRSVAERALQTKHLAIRAFFSTAFTLWTRNNELIKLTRRDIEMNCKGPPPYHEDYFEITISNRKGWQSKLDQSNEYGQLSSYRIYNQPDKHCINCYEHLPKFLRYLELHHYCEDLKPDDFIFPAIGANQIIQRGEHAAVDTVQAWLDDSVEKSGIDQLSRFSFSTHCFRRGGAQYRFQYAPVGERWTLDCIRYWGNWAEREHNDTLLRYLIDEVSAAEHDHRDILNAAAPEPHKSYMSEHSVNELVTKGELRCMFNALDRKISDGFEAVQNSIGEVRQSTLHATLSTTSTRHVLLPAQNLLNQESGPITTAYDADVQMTELNVENNPPELGDHGANDDEMTDPALPPPNLCVPKLPLHGHTAADSLSDIVFHWENPDDSIGLPKAMRDWPTSWYHGKNRRHFSSARDQRKWVALEYIDFYNRDDAAFKLAYPKWYTGHTYLYKEILKARKTRGDTAGRISRKSGADKVIEAASV